MSIGKKTKTNKKQNRTFFKLKSWSSLLFWYCGSVINHCDRGEKSSDITFSKQRLDTGSKQSDRLFLNNSVIQDSILKYG